MTKLTASEIKLRLKEVTTEEDLWFQSILTDDRKSVQTSIASTFKRFEKQKKLEAHFKEMWQYEEQAKTKGATYIAGIDEVGRGPLAGPVVACAVILPDSFDVLEVNDSKQLSLSKREELYDKIMDQAIAVGIGMKDASVVDEVNIYQATKLAMIDAVTELSIQPDFLLIDAMTLDMPIPQENIIKGDAKSISIACASIIAKVTRDRMMVAYDKEFPGYGFANNAGYGTKVHLEGIETYGITPIHRKTFAPIKNK